MFWLCNDPDFIKPLRPPLHWFHLLHFLISRFPKDLSRCAFGWQGNQHWVLMQLVIRLPHHALDRYKDVLWVLGLRFESIFKVFNKVSGISLKSRLHLFPFDWSLVGWNSRLFLLHLALPSLFHFTFLPSNGDGLKIHLLSLLLFLISQALELTRMVCHLFFQQLQIF